MVLRKTLGALLCLFTLCQVVTAQVNPPQACPIYIAHELHKGEISSVARSSENIDCRAGSVVWDNVNRTKQNDQAYASLTMTRIQRGECLKLTDFDLNIPPGAAITGLQVDFFGHRVGSALLTTSMYLVGKGGQKLSSNQAPWVKGDDWPIGMPGFDQKWWYGGRNETWGVNLTDDMVNDPDFGIEFQVRKPIGRDTSVARIDYIRMTVHYTPLYTLCHDSCTVFYVDPIPEANSYHWTLPPDAMLVSKDPNSNIINLNVKNMSYGIFDICVETQSNQGRSIPCCSKFRLAECQTGSIGDRLWSDVNNDGVQDPREKGLANIQLDLMDANSQSLMTTTTTDSLGIYSFDDITEGHYYIQADLPPGLSWSPFLNADEDIDNDFDQSNGPGTSRTFFLPSGSQVTNIDGGVFASTQLGDFVWNDLNENGIQDSGEPGIPDVRMYLLDNNNAILDSTLTDQDGLYAFQGLNPGNYAIEVHIPSGFVSTVSNVGMDDALDSDVDENGRSALVAINFGQIEKDLDVGLFGISKIGGIAFYDRAGNGIQDAIDPELGDISMMLLDLNGNILSQTTTDSLGQYCFDSIPSGEYQVMFDWDTSFVVSAKDQGIDDTVDSDINSNGKSDLFTISNSDTILIDGGGRPICQAFAPEIELEGPKPCFQGTPFLLDVININPPIIPAGYDMMYLMVDPVDLTIRSGSNVPVFNISQAGGYTIFALVYNDDVDDPEYLDLSSYINSNATVTALQSDINTRFLCASFSLPFSFIVDDCSSMAGYVWNDLDLNDIQTMSDVPYADVQVTLLNSAGVTLEIDSTDAQGRYIFEGLLPGIYRIEVESPLDFEFSAKDFGMDDSVDSDVDQDGRSDLITLASGQKETIDAGLKSSCEIGLGFIDDIRMDAVCWSREEILLSATEIDKGIIPNEFKLTYLLSRDGWVYDTAPSPEFIIDSFGLYCIHAMIYDPRPQSSQYFNLDQVLENALTVDETFDLIFENDRCAEFDIDGLCIEVVECASVGDRTWEDSNENGIQDPGENGFNGISVDLMDGLTDTMVASAITANVNGEDGFYRFDKLMPGPYYLIFSTPFGFEATLADQGGDDGLDSDLDEGNGPGSTSTFLLGGGKDDTRDAGFIPQGATIGDLIWEDMNGNGLQDINEPGINGLQIELVNDQGVIINSTTSMNNGGVDGTYQFSGVLPASYFLRIINPQSYLTTLSNVGMDEALDNDLDNGNGDYTTSTFSVVANQVIEDLDMGLFRWASVGDRIWYDENNNGVQDLGEGGVNGVKIKLLDGSGTPLDSTISSGQAPNEGTYLFDSIVPGAYYINVDHPNGTAFTLPFVGNNAGLDNNMDEANGSNTSATFILASNAAEMSVDVGLTSTSCIGDLVWNEVGFNGLYDFFERGINDVTVRLRDVNGFLIDTTVTDNDTSGNPGFYQFVNVQPGNYYLEFDFDDQYCVTLADQGMDEEVDSDVTGDNGPNTTATFSIALGDTLKNIDLGLSEKASIGNRTWCDANADGLQDPDEEGINDIKVFLYTEVGDLLDSTMTADLPGTTDAGFYSFEDVSPGNYYLIFGEAPDKVQTLANAGNDESQDSDVDNSNGFGSTSIISLSPGENEKDVDAGYIDPGLLKAKVGDYVWLDRDNDGIQDRFESGLNGVTVELFTQDDILVASTVSDYHPQLFAPGYYHFEDIEAGQYYLVFTASLDYEFAASFAGFDDEKDSDISNVKSYGSTNILSFYAGEEKLDIDAGFVQVGSLGNYVWLDENANGYQDPAESGMNGVAVWLYDRSGALADSTTTGPDGMGNDGYYVFEDMDPSGYYLKIDLPSGYAFTEPNTGGDDTKDSDIDHSNGFGTSSIINISPGEHDRDADAGLHPEGIIGRMAWKDDNYNGVRDAGEKGVEKVKVYLYNLQDSMIYQTETNKQGTYFFDRVPMGKYYVMFDVADDYDFAPSNMASESKDCDVTHRYGYGTTDAMDIYPGQSYLMLDAGVVPSIFLSAEILEFEVSATEDVVEIMWSMGDETELESYEIERRHEDETKYHPVFYTQTNSSNLGQYQMEDVLTNSGTYFYRLKVMTLEEKPLYSAVKTVDFYKETEGNAPWRIYPNPVVDYIYLQSEQAFQENQAWEIISLDGRVWGSGEIDDSLLKIDLSHLSSGVYVLHIKDNHRILERKMVQLVK